LVFWSCAQVLAVAMGGYGRWWVLVWSVRMLVGRAVMDWCWVSGCRVGQCVGAGFAVIGYAIGLSVDVGSAAKVLLAAIDHMSAILFLMLQE
ncbi:hypothetical protein U1Q18_015262, partial [Sarracenia purpurea var. burkii]